MARALIGSSRPLLVLCAYHIEECLYAERINPLRCVRTMLALGMLVVCVYTGGLRVCEGSL